MVQEFPCHWHWKQGGHRKRSIRKCKQEAFSIKGNFNIWEFNHFQDEIEFNIVREFHHLCPVVALSWSPLSSIDTVPKVCKFATAGVDGKIRIYNSDLVNSETILVSTI